MREVGEVRKGRVHGKVSKMNIEVWGRENEGLR